MMKGCPFPCVSRRKTAWTVSPVNHLLRQVSRLITPKTARGLWWIRRVRARQPSRVDLRESEDHLCGWLTTVGELLVAAS